MPTQKRPRDPIQLAKLIGDIATGKVEDTISDMKKDTQPKRGSAGGLKGGMARAEKLTEEQRTKIAKRGAEVRWQGKITKKP